MYISADPSRWQGEGAGGEWSEDRPAQPAALSRIGFSWFQKATVGSGNGRKKDAFDTHWQGDLASRKLARRFSIQELIFFGGQRSPAGALQGVG